MRGGIDENDILDALDLKRKRCVRKWTPEEDQEMVDMVAQHGTKMWGLIGSKLKDRTGKQCRERYVRHGQDASVMIPVAVIFSRKWKETLSKAQQ